MDIDIILAFATSVIIIGIIIYFVEIKPNIDKRNTAKEKKKRNKQFPYKKRRKENG